MLIAFEGGEGSGKGTQIKLLEEKLKALGYKTLSIFEPGGTDLGHALRDILLNREDLNIFPIVEAYIFTASRAQQILEVTKEALADGYIVLSDRSFYSTYAYQGYGRGLDLNFLTTITEYAVSNVKPDLVFLLDIPPEIGIKRKHDQQEVNRLDKVDLKFHKRVRKGFLELAKKDVQRWRVLDATEQVLEISSVVFKETIKLL